VFEVSTEEDISQARGPSEGTKRTLTSRNEKTGYLSDYLKSGGNKKKRLKEGGEFEETAIHKILPSKREHEGRLPP